jgi:polysaccharide biosynthesis/export protein
MRNLVFPSFFCFLITLIVLGSSCASTKESVYFYGQNDTTLANRLSSLEYPIQNNDLLSISVSSLNPEATAVFNTPNVSSVIYSPSTGGYIQSSGYLVNSEGNVQFPILGNVKASGLTKAQLRKEITDELGKRKLLVDPIVQIRHLNFRVTVLGEVGRPTVIPVPNEKITLLEAIGLAGDLTIYARRDNVMVIREANNQKVIKRLNLNSKEIFTSPYYYLLPNDIVYVEPNETKVASASNTRLWLPVVLSGLTLAAVILEIIVN